MNEGLKADEKKDLSQFQNGIGTRLGMEMYQNESNTLAQVFADGLKRGGATTKNIHRGGTEARRRQKESQIKISPQRTQRNPGGAKG